MNKLKMLVVLGLAATGLAIVAVAVSATTPNQITNGDAESNGTQGWTTGDPLNFGSSWCVGTVPGTEAFQNVSWNDTDAPNGPGPGGGFGNRVFIGDSNDEVNACMYQTINVVPHQHLTHYTLSIWLGADDGSGDTDDARARVCFRNAAGKKIGCSKNLIVENGGNNFGGVLQLRDDSDLLPHAAATATVQVALDEDGADTENEAAFDNASLTFWN